jgi:ribosome-associated protein
MANEWRKYKKMKPRDVILNQEPVELYKILKFENLVMSGGEAKHVITEGMVTVNGEVETRKRKKIFAGDIVEFQGEQMHLVMGGAHCDA